MRRKVRCPERYLNGEQCERERGHTGNHRLPSGHRCHARGCDVRVPPTMLMCRTHWFSVQKKIQRAVWATYREGQCDDKRPSAAWHEAADAAIGYVATLDDQPLRMAEVSALKKFGYTVGCGDDGKLKAQTVPSVVD